jgi:hypothetical protein
MSGPDAMQGEMPGFSFPGRLGGEHDEPLLDMIIARRALPPDAPQEMHDLARMLAALAGPGEPDELVSSELAPGWGAPGELAGEAAALAAFVRLASPAGISPAARRPVRRHRRSRRPRRRASSWAGLAAATVAAAVMLSVLAAYAGVLPTPVQQLAHDAVAAPPPHHAGPEPSPAARSSLTGAGAGPAGSSGQPDPRPHQSAGPVARASQPGPSGARPASAPAPVHGATSAGCVPSQGPSQQPGARVPADSGSPYWWPPVRCGGSAGPVGPVGPTRPAPEPTRPAAYIP